MLTFNIGIKIWNYIKSSIIDGYRYLFDSKNRQMLGYWYYSPINNIVLNPQDKRKFNSYIPLPKNKYQKQIADRNRYMSIPLPPPISRRKTNTWEDTLRNYEDPPKDFIT